MPCSAGTASGTITGMATNLRLRPEAEQAVRAEAERTGRSQQEVIREAVDRYLGLTAAPSPRSASETLVASQAVLPARSPYRELDEPIRLPEGTGTLDLLDREDRY